MEHLKTAFDHFITACNEQQEADDDLDSSSSMKAVKYEGGYFYHMTRSKRHLNERGEPKWSDSDGTTDTRSSDS